MAPDFTNELAQSPNCGSGVLELVGHVRVTLLGDTSQPAPPSGLEPARTLRLLCLDEADLVTDSERERYVSALADALVEANRGRISWRASIEQARMFALLRSTGGPDDVPRWAA